MKLPFEASEAGGGVLLCGSGLDGVINRTGTGADRRASNSPSLDQRSRSVFNDRIISPGSAEFIRYNHGEP
jgi:hypothetical protein